MRDAAGAFANAVIIVVAGRSLLTTLRRHAHRLDPVTVLETADEVLDYREAVAFYAGAFHSVVQGGDHSLASFPEFVTDIVAWAREAPPTAAKANP